MKFRNQEKGVAGLTILLSIITMLFVMGLLVMIFALMGGEIINSDTVSKAFTSASVTENGISFVDGGLTLTECGTQNKGAITSLTMINATATTTVPSANYTISNCIVSPSQASVWNNTVVNATYVYTYASGAYAVMNDSVSGISNVTDWYDIFIVIASMVVLILLTVIIIGAIRSSGLMADGVGGGNRNVGSA